MGNDRFKVEGVSALRRVMLDPPRGFGGYAFDAVGDLQAIGDHEAVEALIDGLEARDEYVSGRAAQALAELRARESIPALIRELDRRDLSSHKRNSFQNALIKLIKHLQLIGDEEAVAALLVLLEVNNPSVAGFAARALAELRAREAVPVLVRVLEVRADDLPAATHLAFVRALRTMPHASAVGVLTTSLYRKQVRSKAARGLQELRTPQATAALETAATQLGWWSGREVRSALRKKKRNGLD
jgi:HEAT repeat protein